MERFPSNHGICKITNDEALQNISTILFEDNNNENNGVHPKEAALQTIEKSFYDILGPNYPSFPSNLPHPNWHHGFSSSIGSFFGSHQIGLPALEFEKGFEEGKKFVPSINDNELVIDLHAKRNGNSIGRKLNECEVKDKDLVRLKGKKHTNDKDLVRLKGKKHTNCGDLSLSLVEGRKDKISVLYFYKQEVVLDKVFFLHEEHFAKEGLRLREIMQSRKNSRSKTETHENLVDLRTLLIHCSQAISINDNQHANQLVKQIRQHSSPDGDGVQRMAHILVKGLEARLNGSSNDLFKQLVVPRFTITEHINGLRIFLLSCPVFMASQYFTNGAILNATGKASKLHIINLGIEFGFTWPCLIHDLSEREGGPPKLRITNIEPPESSSSAAERNEVVGRKLAGFSSTCGVPLEYRGICTKLDEIHVEDLNIEKDEVLIVNCVHGFENLGDETYLTCNPKDLVLDIIRQINPQVFTQAIINASFNGLVFADRFKQMLLYISAVFDIFDATIPQSNKQRWFFENYVWGPMAINVIACEGSERFVRPETYKQWHRRNSRAGFEQFRLDRATFKKIKNKMREVYNKDFFVENDNECLLLGWKGRVTTVFSTWHQR